MRRPEMKAIRGVVKGKTIILEEEPDLPENCPAQVYITPLDEQSEEEIARGQIELLARPHRGGRLVKHSREELHER